MAIRFVDKTPATTEADTPADAAAHDPQAPAVGPDAAEPGACEPIASPRPKPRRRKADAEPAPAGPEGGDADAAEAPKGPEAASAALPGFEDSPKPKRRRGAARPYWGFG